MTIFVICVGSSLLSKAMDVTIINVMVHLKNRLSTDLHYVIIKAQIANLEKLTDLSEEAVSLISGDYSPYSKV